MISTAQPPTAPLIARPLASEPCLARAQLPDDVLVRACLGGTAAAWDELVERYASLIYTTARRHGLNEADSEDITQNVFVIVLNNLKKLRKQSSLAAWITTITRREAYRFCVEHHRAWDAAIQEIEELPCDGDDLQRIELQELVRQAAAQLGRSERALIDALLADPRLSYSEITELTGLPHGSIGPTRNRSFSKLQAILLDLGFQP